MKWKADHFSQNLRRFYGKNLPLHSNKEKECGIGSFTLIIVEDTHPIYAPRYTNQGVSTVNINMFDMKELIRKEVCGNVLHATNTPQEFEHDVVLLLGINSKDLISSNYRIDNSEQELWYMPGENGWNSIKELLYVLNSTSKYVILRNFENFPDQVEYGKHSDIDMLCDSYQTTQLILNGQPTTSTRSRVQNTLRIADDYINIDIRFIGDGYLDKKWETDILNFRLIDNKQFYRPNETFYLFSLIYHALIQKGTISQDYIDRVKDLSERILSFPIILSDERMALSALESYMQSQGYKFVEPSDKSVAFNYFKVGASASLNRRLHHLRNVISNAVKDRSN